MIRLITRLAVFTLAATGIAQTDKADKTEKKPAATVEQLIQQGLDARRAGKNPEAIKLLQTAIDKIQAETAGDLASFLPAAMEGFEHDDEKPTSGSWNAGGENFQWSQARRTYTRESDGARVVVTITSWPQLIQGQRAMLQMFSNPQMLEMMNADPKKSITALDAGSFAGWKTIEKGSSAQLVAIGTSLMIMIDCDQDDEKILDHHWSGIDRERLAPIDAQSAAKK